MKKILIVGISGFVGSNLAVYLRRKYRVYGTFNTHKPQIDDVPCLRFPIQPEAPIRDFVRKINPHTIVYCAAQTDARKSDSDKNATEFLNAEAPYQFARAAGESGGRLIYLSSSKVFSGKVFSGKVFSGERGGYTEKDTPSPTTLYGLSKVHGEELLLSHCENACTIRIGTVFGMGSHFQHQAILARCLRKFWRNEKTDFIQDEYRSFISVFTLCEALGNLIETGHNNTNLFHLGAKESHSYYSFAKTILEVFQLPSNLAFPISGAQFAGEDAAFGGKRGQNLCLNSDLFSDSYSFPFPALEKSLEQVRARIEKGSDPY